MGITISSKRHGCDMGYSGFNRFRNAVAEKVSKKFSEHYASLDKIEVMVLCGRNRDNFFKKYNAITEELIDQKEVTVEVANFLYQADCNGKIDRKQAKEIYSLIKECNNNISFGYSGRKDCAKMSDLKNIFSDGTKVEWC
jgi:hypothetical protein